MTRRDQPVTDATRFDGRVGRRRFLALLGSAAVPLAAPRTAVAQSPKPRSIGFLGASSAAAQVDWTAAFVQRLRELGWIEGKTVTIEYRWAEGRNERFAEFAAEFVKLNVDLILTDGGATLAAKKVTSTIPIVFAVAADPLGGGYVASLSRPGGNVTGTSVQAFDTAGKRLGLLRDVVPDLRRVAVLVNPNYAAAVKETEQAEAAGQQLGIEVIRAETRVPADFATAIESVTGRVNALYVCTDSFANSNRGAINTASLAARLPAMQSFREAARQGGLMSYGANFPALFRRAGEKADMILRGAKPGDLPVEQPTKFDFVINLKTARQLGLEVPEPVLALADEVIE